jgi:hypothetical protein
VYLQIVQEQSGQISCTSLQYFLLPFYPPAK